MTKSTHVVDVFQNNQYTPLKGWILKNFKIKENESTFPLVNPDSYKRCKQPIYKEMRELNYPLKGNDRLYKKLNTIEDLHNCWFHLVTKGKYLRIYVLNPDSWEVNFFITARIKYLILMESLISQRALLNYTSLRKP